MRYLVASIRLFQGLHYLNEDVGVAIFSCLGVLVQRADHEAYFFFGYSSSSQTAVDSGMQADILLMLSFIVSSSLVPLF